MIRLTELPNLNTDLKYTLLRTQDRHTHKHARAGAYIMQRVKLKLIVILSSVIVLEPKYHCCKHRWHQQYSTMPSKCVRPPSYCSKSNSFGLFFTRSVAFELILVLLTKRKMQQLIGVMANCWSWSQSETALIRWFQSGNWNYSKVRNKVIIFWEVIKTRIWTLLLIHADSQFRPLRISH